MQYRPGYPQTSTAIQEEIWVDISKRVDYQSLQWDQQATEQNTVLRFDIFTMLSLSTTRYDDYPSWVASGDALDANTDTSLGMVDAINDPSFFIDVANRTEVKVQEWELVDGHYEIVKTLWGGVVSSVDTERSGDSFIVQRVECSDYTALLDELIVRDYNAPTVSEELAERATISGLTTEVITGGLTLTAGPYTFRVVAYDASDEIVDIFTHVSQNLTPTDIDPPGISDTPLRTIKLDWTSVAGATYYKVFAKSGIGVKDMYYKATVASPTVTYNLSTAPAVSGELSPEGKVQKGSIDIDIVRGSTDPANANYKGIFNAIDPDLNPGIDNQTAYVETAKKLNDGTPDPDKSYRFSPTLETGVVLTSPFGGKTIKQALNIITEKTGSVFWVDANKDLHYTNKQARELVENPRFESSPAATGFSVAAGHSIAQDRGPFGYGRALVASAGATTAESKTDPIPVTANEYYFARVRGWAKTNFSAHWDAELVFYSNLAGTTQVGNAHKLHRNIAFDSTDDGRWCKTWVLAQAHSTAVTARIIAKKKSNGSDEVAWTDFSLVELTGSIGFSDTPSEVAYALPMKSFETPKAPRSASKVANRLLVYGVYKNIKNPSELESIETDINLTLKKVAAGSLAAAKYYVRVVATVSGEDVICTYATETITDQDVIDGNRELFAEWAGVPGATQYKIYVGTKRFAMRLKATQAGTTLSIQSPAAGGAAVSPEPEVYYYKLFDFAPGIWESGGKILEAAINDSLVDNDDKAQTRALSFWEEKGIAERTWEFDTFEETVPMVGEVIPFVWAADDTAEPLMVKGIKARLLGERVYYTVTVGDDPLLTKRGVTQIFADMQAATARLNDTIAPEPPQSLVVSAPSASLIQTPDGVTRASVTAQWTPSPEDDFAYYSVEYGYDPNFTEVQRANVSQTSDSQSASTGVKANVVHTFQAEPGKTLYYRVAAIDQTNNRSQWSSDEIVTPQDTTPCDPPTALTVEPGLRSNTLTWSFEFYDPTTPTENTNNTDFARFRLYRRVHNTGSYVAVAETSATQYVDTDFADYTSGYNYAVTSLDRTGNESGTPGTGGATGVAYNTTNSVPSKINGGVDITTASITGAEIASATITDANIGSINADKITAGTLSVSTGMTIVSDGTAAAPQFEVGPNGIIIRDDDGNTVLEVNGSTANLNADYLTVTGVEATEITVGAGDSVVRVGNYPNSVSPTFQGIWGGNANPSSAAFTLSTSGAMTATSASITGSVTANSGAIGGWSLSSTSLTGGNTTISSTGDITLGTGANVARLSSSDAAYRLWLGGTTASTAPFRVTSTGSFVATDITATGGTVGGWSLTSTSLTAGSGSNSVGINASGSGAAIYAGSSSSTTAPFQVSNNGAVQAKNLTVLGGKVLIGEIGPEITEISLAATTGIVTVTTVETIDTEKYSVGTKILVDTSGTYASADWANGYFVISSASGTTLTYQSNDFISGPLSDASAEGLIYLGSQMAVGGDGGATASWMVVEGNKFALRNPADPLVTVIEATVGAVTINADFINAGSINIGDLDNNALTTTNFSVTNAGVVTAGSGDNVAVISPTDPVYRLWLGHSTGASAPFSVTSTGALTATSASITGTITATSGSIGGWSVDSSKIYNALAISPYIAGLQGTSTSTGVAFFAGAATSTGGSAAFTVDNSGAVTASNITATGGSVYASLLKNQPDKPLLITAGGTDTTFTTQGGASPASTSGDIGIIGQSSSLLIANKNAYSQAVTGITLDPGIEPEGANVDEFYGGATGAVYAQTTEQATGAVDIQYLASRGQRESSSRIVSSYANRFLIGSVERSGTTATIRGIGDQLYELILSGAVKVGSVFVVDLTLNSPDATTYSQINGSGKTVTSINATYPGSISYTTATSATLAQTTATGFYDLVDNVASSVETYALNWLDIDFDTISRTAGGVVTLTAAAGGLDLYLAATDKFYVNITSPDSTYSANEGWQTVTSVTSTTVVYSSTGGLVSTTPVTGTISLRNSYSKSGFRIKSGYDTVVLEGDDEQGSLNISTTTSMDVINTARFGWSTSLDFATNGPSDGILTSASSDYAQFIYSNGIVIGAKVAPESGGVGYGAQGVGASITFEAYDDNVSVAQSPVYVYMKEDVPASGVAGLAVSGSLRIDRTSASTLSSANHGFQIGPSSGQNLRMDTNEINSVSNGAVADLYLNHYGGDVHIGQAATSAGDLVLGTSATSVTGAIIFKDGTGGSIRAYSATSGNTSIGIYNSTGSAFAPLVADSFFPGGQGSFRLDHDGNFDFNDSVDVTGNITATGNMTATGSVTGSTLSTAGNVSTNGAGLFHDTPTGVTLASGSTVGRTALWTLNSGTQYNLQRWTSTSTAALKKNIRPITSLAPEQIYNLSLVDFEYDMDKFAELYPHINVEAIGEQRGVIWEQVSEVLPEAAVQGYGPGDPPTIDWEALYFGALVAIQDLNERLKVLEEA